MIISTSGYLTWTASVPAQNVLFAFPADVAWIVDRCWDLAGTLTHQKHHIKDELINDPDVNYHKKYITELKKH